MTELLTPTWAGSVGTALGAIASQVTPVDNARWTFVLGNGASRPVTATIATGWLGLEAHFCPHPDGAAGGPEIHWAALAANAALPGLAKFVLHAAGGLRLRADLPLHEDLDLASQIRAACAGFEYAWAGGEPAAAGRGPPSSPDAGAVHRDQLKQVCAEAGWPCLERSSGKLVVDLEVAPGFYQASLVPTGRGLRVSCDLVECEAEPLVCRQAMAGLLLAAAAAVRLVRPAIDPGAGLPVARFEVVFDAPPGPLELAGALASLSAGCSLCGDEIKMLQDAGLARHYLELRGCGWANDGRKNERETTHDPNNENRDTGR